MAPDGQALDPEDELEDEVEEDDDDEDDVHHWACATDAPIRNRPMTAITKTVRTVFLSITIHPSINGFIVKGFPVLGIPAVFPFEPFGSPPVFAFHLAVCEQSVCDCRNPLQIMRLQKLYFFIS